MRADREDQFSHQPNRKRFPFVELLLALAVAAGLVLFWRYWQESVPTGPPAIDEPTAAAPAVPAQPELPPTPDIPRRGAQAPTADAPAATVPDPDAEPSPELPAPPPLTPAQGNEFLRRELAEAGTNSDLAAQLAASAQPLETTAALIDGLGRGLILRKVFQASPPTPGFRVEQRGELFYMDEANYDRYDDLALKVSAMDAERLVDGFHALRPLYEAAYDKLGLDPADFDNAVIRTLDLVLATPEVDGPIALKPKSVAYVYADPALESLPAVQKQLLRMGPDNIRLLKEQAKALRDELLSSR
jgi:hypothetical protein